MDITQDAIYRLYKQFEKSGIIYLFVNPRDINKSFVALQVQDNIRTTELEKWHYDLEREKRRGVCGNKLRTYRTFKNHHKTGHYLTHLIPRRHRSAFSKFRCGVAPLRLDMGRYENLQVHERICLFCSDRQIEYEAHVLLHCPLYGDLRQVMFQNILAHNANFLSLNEHKKL